jgi:signal transduction histidine kinase
MPPGAEVPARADARLVGQLVVNLVQNAILHGPAGTTIRLRADIGEGAIVQVADDGPGIPEALREAVLDPFVRLDEARSTSGTGLGLTLVRAIAAHHGAELRLEDAGPGLRVTVRFPAV